MSSKLYVGNISFNMEEEKLEEVFSSYGEVKSTKIIKDRDTGRSRGFAFVEMSSEEQAQEVISQLDGQEVEGRNIRVSAAKERSSSDRPRRGNFEKRF